ncbi:MAG: toxin HicA [Proteobacteria bacterium SG_bin4]|nr:MAG: toxin HicA [Proteobacteria bacterium SG_bin4]
MGKFSKLRMKILTGNADTDIAFSELRQLLLRLRFNERIKGSHHIFTRENIEEIINLQPKDGKAKPYQVKQVRILLMKYRMGEYSVD